MDVPVAPGAIRAEDIEPYFALQYVARLFKIAAMVVVVALTAEVIAGVALEGAGAIFPLFAEVIRGIVLAAILWGAGDLTILLIDVGHDVRAARDLVQRQLLALVLGDEVLREPDQHLDAGVAGLGPVLVAGDEDAHRAPRALEPSPRHGGS